MNVCPIIFNNIDEALIYARQLQNRMPADKTRESISEQLRHEFLFNPYSSFENNADDEKFIVCRLESGRYSLKPNLHGHRFLYRGLHKFYKDCAPSVYRNRMQDYFIDEMIRCQEEQLLMLSHPLVRLLDHGILLGGETFVFEMNLYGLAQHYYNKTPFIDLTSDISVAAFFATNKYNEKEDFYYPAVDGIGCLYLYELREAIDFKDPPFPHLSTIGLQVFPRSGLQRGFLYRMELGENFNDLGNLYLLKFKQRKLFSDKYNRKYQQGKALFPDDILSHHWQTYNKDPKVVSKKAVKLNVSWNRSETYDSISSKLHERGYKIGDYTPSFTSEELHAYYYSAPDFWTNFCNQIYFPGDDDSQLHRQMLDAINNTNYQWAFDESKKIDMSNLHGYVYDRYKRDCGA